MSSIYDAWDNGDRPAIRRRFARLEEITRMAQEAGIRVAGPMDSVDPKNIYAHELERFAVLVAAAERQKWVGLTATEQMQVAIVCGCADVAWIDFACAIEAKLKEKNT